jgi:hypothetical protein
LTIRLGTPVKGLHHENRTLATAMSSVHCEALLVGSRGCPRPVQGAERRGFHASRTLDPAGVRLARRLRRAPIVGGRVARLDAFSGRHRRGITAMLLVRDRGPAQAALDPAAGALVAPRVARPWLDIRDGFNVDRLEDVRGRWQRRLRRMGSGWRRISRWWRLDRARSSAGWRAVVSQSAVA